MSQKIKSNEKKHKEIPGITREAEIDMLAKVLSIADEKLNRTRQSVADFANDILELKEVYDLEDREGLAQMFQADARFHEAKQELLRSERCRKKPYFGRIDFQDLEKGIDESYYIGKAVIAENPAEPEVIDWRAPIASVYYEKALGKCTYSVLGEGAFEIDLSRKRTYEIEHDELKDFYDSDVVANDELLTKYLAKNKKAVLSEIIATIQQEQNEIIRKKPQHNVLVQGSAGSGKTTVAMHRISYILYNYNLEFKPEDFYIIGSNQILLNYITGILPDLDVYGATQMTMEQLFTRLLYEDWDAKKYTVKSMNKSRKSACMKGRFDWFHDLEAFCEQYEWSCIPRKDVYIEKTNKLLMKQETIEELLKRFSELSLPDKLDKLTEHLMAQLENEIYGKYHTYPQAEQKSLIKYYQTYFGKKEWKGSIFSMYDDFLNEQNAKGAHVDLPGNEFDVYDLAALAYIYKRIKETEVIQEASHVVIDEAQDFGMMVYGSLKYCLSKCTYTIMGDVSQNIYFDYGLSDWEDLRSLMLPGEFDYFGLLRKSYRNTVEISNFATNILQHGTFPIYPVEPIIRHGNEVRVTKCAGKTELVNEVVNTISAWKDNGYETIAVICRDEKESERVAGRLKKSMEIVEFDASTTEFGNGVMVLPIEYAKGLEFDVVILFDANELNYPMEDGFAKLLYVAATRALHELVVLYDGVLTSLIATQVPEEKKRQFIDVQQTASSHKVTEAEELTKDEIAAQRAKDGHRELEMRNYLGPKRITVQHKRETSISKRVPIQRKSIASKEYFGSTYGRSSIIGKAARERAQAMELSAQSEFGEVPENAALRPIGHSSIDLSVRWISKHAKWLDVMSNYGLLRLTPVSPDTIRISFAKEQIDALSDVPQEISVTPDLKWKCKESKDLIEVSTEKLIVRIVKKTGMLSFYTAAGKLLLSENSKVPRQLECRAKKQSWTYFDWSKKEVIKARGATDSHWIEIKNSARYISHGEDSARLSCLMSNAGYQLLVPGGVRTMCSTIPLYGTYLYMEGKKQIDYFFRTAL